jgi:hypothetical protein
MRKTEPLDSALNLKLSNIEMDGKGIAWNDFVNKRKKKKAFFFFKTFGFSTLVLAGLFMYLSPFCKTQIPKTNGQGHLISQHSANIKNASNQSGITKKNKNNKLIIRDLPNTTQATQKILVEDIPLNGIFKQWNIQAEIPSELNDKQLIISQNTTTFDENNLPLKQANWIPISHILPDNEVSINPVENSEKKPDDPKSKTFIEFGITGISSTQHLRINELGKSFVHKDYAGIRNAAENGRYGFGFNFSCGKIFNNWEISIGLNYNRLSSKSHYNFIYKDRPIIDIDGKIIGYNSGNEKTINFTSLQSSSFVEIPLQLDFYIKNKNPLNFNKKGLHLGLYPQFLQSNLGQLPNTQFLDLKDNLNTENYKTGMIGFEIGVNFKHKINDKVNIKLMPYYRINSGLRQVQSHYTTRMNYLGLKCMFQLGL